MGLFSIKDSSQTKQREQVKEKYPDFIANKILSGENCNVVSGAEGEFGFNRKNPIPVNGIGGEIIYLNRLKCPCYKSFMYHRLGSVEVNKKMVDIYEIVCRTGKHWDLLYFDMYHPRRSKKTPKNYTFGPYHNISSNISVPIAGTNNFVKDFPSNFPEYIIQDKERRDPFIHRLMEKSAEMVKKDISNKNFNTHRPNFIEKIYVELGIITELDIKEKKLWGILYDNYPDLANDEINKKFVSKYHKLLSSKKMNLDKMSLDQCIILAVEVANQMELLNMILLNKKMEAKRILEKEFSDLKFENDKDYKLNNKVDTIYADLIKNRNLNILSLSVDAHTKIYREAIKMVMGNNKSNEKQPEMNDSRNKTPKKSFSKLIGDYKLVEYIIVTSHKWAKLIMSKKPPKEKEVAKPISKKEIGVFLELICFWSYFVSKKVFDNYNDPKRSDILSLFRLQLITDVSYGLQKLKIIPIAIKDSDFYVKNLDRIEEYSKCKKLYERPAYQKQLGEIDGEEYIKLQNKWVNDNLLQKTALNIDKETNRKSLLDGLTVEIVIQLFDGIKMLNKIIDYNKVGDAILKYLNQERQ